MPTTVPEPGTGVAQPLVDHREAVRHGLERRAHDVEGPRRQREAHDGGPRAGDPAEAPLPGQEREHRQPVGIGLHRLEHLLHALERGQVEGLGEPRVEAPAIRQGAAQEEATAVHAVAPEAVRDRDRVGGEADPHRAGRPDHERRPLRRRAAGADVGARAVAQRRQPRDARQRGPARRRTRAGARGRAGRGRRWVRGARRRARGPRGCPGPSAAPTGRRGRSPTPSRRSCGARRRDEAPRTPRTRPSVAPRETRQGRARGATRAAPGDRTCEAGIRPARGTPSRRPARGAPPPRRRSACPPRNRRGCDGRSSGPSPSTVCQKVLVATAATPPARGPSTAMRASSASAVSANSRSASISTPPSGVVVGSYGCWHPRSSPRPSRSKASARTEDEPTSSATRIGSAGGGATRTRSC